MGATKVVIGGLLVALTFAGCVVAEKTCNTPTGKQECKHDLKKDEYLLVKCPSGSTYNPQDAFQATDKEVCKAALDFEATCSDSGKLSELVPGAEISFPDSSKKYEFKVANKKELSSDVSTYATCLSGDNGYKIGIKFLKGSSSSSNRATMTAVLIGAVTTLMAIARV